MFHRTRDAIEAHLTIVITALAVAHNIQERTGRAIANVTKQLRPLRSATIAINGTIEAFPPPVPAPQQKILETSASPNRGTKRNVLSQVRRRIPAGGALGTGANDLAGARSSESQQPRLS